MSRYKINFFVSRYVRIATCTCTRHIVIHSNALRLGAVNRLNLIFFKTTQLVKVGQKNI